MIRKKSPPIPRPGALNTIGRVRGELASLYRDARSGKIPPSDATRFAYILNMLARMIEQEDLESRLRIVEDSLEMR